VGEELEQRLVSTTLTYDGQIRIKWVSRIYHTSVNCSRVYRE